MSQSNLASSKDRKVSDSSPPQMPKWLPGVLQSLILALLLGGVTLALDMRDRMTRVETRLDNIRDRIVAIEKSVK